MKKIVMMALLSSALLGTAAYAHDSQCAGKAPQAAQHQMFSGLSPAGAATMQQTVATAHQQNKELMIRDKSLHEELQAIIAADSFDAGAFMNKQGEITHLQGVIKDNMDNAFAAALEHLSAADRAVVAADMQKHARGMHQWHHPHDGDAPASK